MVRSKTSTLDVNWLSAEQEAVIEVVHSNNLSTKHLPSRCTRFDEWYNFKDIQPDLLVLLTIHENRYTGGANGDLHPMSWYHESDGGRAFYTELGHTNESFVDPNYLRHILGGIQYAIFSTNAGTNHPHPKPGPKKT